MKETLKKGEYVDHIIRDKDGSVFVCLVLKEGIFNGVIERDEI